VTVLLLHAFPLDERMWELQRPALEGHDVIAPRLYGRGRTMNAWAESRAAETDGLLLLGARPDADSDERRAGRADTIELIRADGPDGLWRMMRPKLFQDDGAADEALLYRDADGLVAAVEAIRDREDSTEVARSSSVPVRFVIGEFDPFVAAGELGGFDVVELGGAGHLANIERPTEFNELLSEFLERV
jgi:pimeloyl-ACP methyl ester carboxylesterase